MEYNESTLQEQQKEKQQQKSKRKKKQKIKKQKSKSSSSPSTILKIVGLLILIAWLIIIIVNVTHHAIILGEGGELAERGKTLMEEFTNTKKEIAHGLAGLSCIDHGGPASAESTDDVVYWSNIPSDAQYKSPFYSPEKYLTFEPDHGGWNNIRMSMETVLVMAIAMGRTLVLPPDARMYLLRHDGNQKAEFSFKDFFHLDIIHNEHDGFHVITMDEFLRRQAMTGNLINPDSNKPMEPPNGQTDWNGQNLKPLWSYLRTVGHTPDWNPKECMVAFPATSHPSNVGSLQKMMEQIQEEGMPSPEDYKGKPLPINANTSSIERLKENLADRTKLCLYDTAMQNANLVHMRVEQKEHVRLLVHFYNFLWFEDWRVENWTKRFVRDHVRYVDDIMCAAARVLEGIRTKAIENRKKRGLSLEGKSSDTDGLGTFDAMHIRRGDFQYKKTRIDADELYDVVKNEFEEGMTLYIATDERDKEFFRPLADHYHLLFLDDFLPLLEGVSKSYYGMIDQVLCTRSRYFFGTWWSTFSGYINRMRGYHGEKRGLRGYEDGVLPSWYFAPLEKKDEMRVYWPSRLPFYMREFPTSWRDIDKGIEELWKTEGDEENIG